MAITDDPKVEAMLKEIYSEEGRKKMAPFIEEPKDYTLDKKLIINVATTGAHLTKEQNPYQALNKEEIAEAVSKAHKAGAAMWHVHTRDDLGRPSLDPNVTIETEDMVFKECPDIITSVSAWGGIGKQGADLISPMIGPLVEAGPKYAQTAVIPAVTMVIGPVVNNIIEPNLRSMAEFLKEKGVKPEFQAFTFEGTRNVNEWLIETGIIEPPYSINAIAGTHAGVHWESPSTPYDWAIIYFMHMMRYMPKNTVIGGTIGGRNWLPLTVAAILLGVQCVRIGMEDSTWMYPHKDDRIETCEQAVTKIATIAKELGREIATPDEAREILGLKKPE